PQLSRHTFDFSVGREFPEQFTVQFAYVGRLGRNLLTHTRDDGVVVETDRRPETVSRIVDASGKFKFLQLPAGKGFGSYEQRDLVASLGGPMKKSLPRRDPQTHSRCPVR